MFCVHFFRFYVTFQLFLRRVHTILLPLCLEMSFPWCPLRDLTRKEFEIFLAKNGKVSRAVNNAKNVHKIVSYHSNASSTTSVNWISAIDRAVCTIHCVVVVGFFCFASAHLLCWTLENVLWLDYISIETKHLFMVRNVCVRVFQHQQKNVFVRKNSHTQQSIHWHTQMVLSQYSSVCYCRWHHTHSRRCRCRRCYCCCCRRVRCHRHNLIKF